MANENGALQMACNGEIYNAPELRAELESMGHVFSSRSDNEVVLHAFEQWREKCLDRLQGMFAFVLWDSARSELFAARDHIGIKPLYWFGDENALGLASEADALIACMPEPPRLDPVAAAYVLTLGYVPSPRCVWQGAYKLRPGSYLSWRPGTQPMTRRWWEPPRHICPGLRHEDWPDLFRSVLSKHLMADVPLALLLSSGIDSAAIAVGLKDLHVSPEAFTLALPADDESDAAGSAAASLNFQHHIVPMPHADRLVAGAIVSQFDEPQGFGALATMDAISESVSARGFRVALAGDGGDEAFGGYRWHRNLLGSNSAPGSQVKQRLKAFFGDADARLEAFAMRSRLHRHAMQIYPRFLPDEVSTLLSPLGVKFCDGQMLEPFQAAFEPKLPLRRALQRLDLLTLCTDSILPKVDRASMHHGLEIRVPFLDRRILEYGLAMPETGQEETEGKALLRQFVSTRLPKEFLLKAKQGFSLRGQSLDLKSCERIISDGWWCQSGALSTDWRRIVFQPSRFLEGRVWALLMLTWWADTHLSEQGLAA